MLEIREIQPLPQRCQECEKVKEDGVDCACYNCDYALERFELVKLDEPQKLL